MNILVQGGWRSGRDDPRSKAAVEAYGKTFARAACSAGHRLILTGTKELDEIIASVAKEWAQESRADARKLLTYYLRESYEVTNTTGRVLRLPPFKWWQQERTYLALRCEAVVAIGGGKGTADCLEKALLLRKPVMVAVAAGGAGAATWARRDQEYCFVEPGDAELFDDLSLTPDEFAAACISMLGKIAERRFSRRIFIVHGQNHQPRDALAHLVRGFGLEPVVLDQQPNAGLTIIEKLERDTSDVGFAFVIYSPDDKGGLAEEGVLRGRTRQNVIFEHGLLVEKLGRERVCALVVGDVEIPSDLSGVIYERLLSIEREAAVIARVLKEAGYLLDLDALLKPRL